MKYMKRFLSICMVFALVITFTGFTSKTANTGIKVDPKTLNGRVTNLNGRTISINIIDATLLDKTTITGKARAERDKVLEKKYNCKIKYVLKQSEHGGNSEIVKSVLAGKPIVDIWAQNGWQELIPHIRAGVLQDLNALKVFNWSEYSKSVEIGAFNGKYYCVRTKMDSTGSGQNDTWLTNVLFYNQKLLDQYGITDDLTALQNNGQWTWDKFAKICKTFNQNVGKSNPELKAVYEWCTIYDDMMGTFKTDWIARDSKTGVYTFNAGNAKAQQAQGLYTKFVKDGVITIPNDARGWTSAFAAGNAAFMFQNLYQMKWTILSASTQDVKDNWGVVELPQVNSGTSNFQAVTNLYNGGFAIPVGVSKPNEVASFLNDWILLEMDSAQKKKAFYEQFVNECLNVRNGEKIKATVGKLYDVCDLEKDTKLYSTFAHLTKPGIGNQTIGVNDSWYTHARNIAVGTEALATVTTSMTDYYNKILAAFSKQR